MKETFRKAYRIDERSVHEELILKFRIEDEELDLDVLNEQLRATMQRLSVCDASLSDLPESCSFAVAVEVSNSDDIQTKDDWVLSESQPRGTRREDLILGKSERMGTMRPIRSVSLGPMLLEVYMEESTSKGKMKA